MKVVDLAGAFSKAALSMCFQPRMPVHEKIDEYVADIGTVEANIRSYWKATGRYMQYGMNMVDANIVDASKQEKEGE